MKNKLQIIAEIAQGFEGNFEQSKLLIKAAAKAGANAVKFQLVYADELATKDYQYYSLFQGLEMEVEKWRALNEYAKHLGIKFIVDVFGEQSLKTAQEVGLTTIKIHGTDVTNIGLLEAVATSSIETVILGIGGSFWGEIATALSILGKKQLVLLCGFQAYPTNTEDNHIARMNVIAAKASAMHQNFSMGFADHPGEDQYANTISLVALGAGASCIEKHLTLGKVMELEDYESALNPDEFRTFVNQLRTGEKALGLGIDTDDFSMSNAENQYRENIRRDVVAVNDLMEGQSIGPENVTLKRTAQEGTIKLISSVIEKKLNNKVLKNQPIKIKDID